MLETVVPRAVRSKVMIVGGAKRGQVKSSAVYTQECVRVVIEYSKFSV